MVCASLLKGGEKRKITRWDITKDPNAALSLLRETYSCKLVSGGLFVSVRASWRATVPL